VFINLIDAAFEAHRQWRDTRDASAYCNWATGFKQNVQSAIEQWLPRAVHAADLWLRSLKTKQHSGGIFWTIQKSPLKINAFFLTRVSQ
jgi:transposase